MLEDAELIKTWRKSGFTLRLFDEYKRGDYGRSYLSYQFKDGRKVIFEGNDFSPSPMYAIDSLQAVYSLLSFLSVKEGDTDSEYFDSYTPEQLAWTRSERCEELAWIVSEWEEKNHAW